MVPLYSLTPSKMASDQADVDIKRPFDAFSIMPLMSNLVLSMSCLFYDTRCFFNISLISLVVSLDAYFIIHCMSVLT